MKYLVIVSPPEEKPRRFELKGKRIGLGREVDNDICVNIDSVSSSHLEFRQTDDGYEMIDLDSTNGTRVNGKVAEKVTLEDGDRLLVGETVPVHFVALAEGEKYEAKTDAGTDQDQAEAAEYAAMSDKLGKLEANIEEKQEEANKLDAKLEELKREFAAKQEEHQKARAELDKLQAELDSKKEASPGADVDVEKLEKELMQQTRKVKLMATDLASREETIEKLAQTKTDKPVAPAKPIKPAAADPATPAAPATPATPASPAAPTVAPAAPGTPAAPAIAKKAPAAAKTPSVAPRKPLPPGAPTVKLTKKMPTPGPPRLPRRPNPEN